MSLFADANDDNVADGATIATTTTAGGGNYSFTGLAPGHYIVQVDASNFSGGGALVATQLSSPGSPDPDNNVDNDDNGAGTPGQAVSSNAITLDYNTEPTTDGDADADTNFTLDFGFMNNPPPSINHLGGDSTTFTQGGAAVLLDTGTAATVTDDQANLNGGKLTVSITVNEVGSEDVLGIQAGVAVALL